MEMNFVFAETCSLTDTVSTCVQGYHYSLACRELWIKSFVYFCHANEIVQKLLSVRAGTSQKMDVV